LFGSIDDVQVLQERCNTRRTRFGTLFGGWELQWW